MLDATSNMCCIVHQVSSTYVHTDDAIAVAVAADGACFLGLLLRLGTCLVPVPVPAAVDDGVRMNKVLASASKVGAKYCRNVLVFSQVT